MLENVVQEYFEKENARLDFESAKKVFNVQGEKEIENLRKIIQNLEKNGIIYLTEYDEYIPFPKYQDMTIGKLKITKDGLCYVETKGGHSVYVDNTNQVGAIGLDTVIINNIYYDDKKILHGSIEKILYREIKDSVFEFVKNSETNFYLKSCNYKVTKKVKVNKNELKDLVDGDRILIDIGMEYNDKQFNGTIINRVCHRDDPNSEIITIAGNYDIDPNFSDGALLELESIPTFVRKEDKKERVDLTEERIFTIDCDDTKDMDDAVSIKRLPNGHYNLKVHIADVSYYVKEGSSIYKDALKKGFSSYLANTVMPMLPHKLSNGICSLNPEEERLTLTIDMDMDELGNVADYNIYESVIKSQKKMKYSEVNKILENDEMVEGYEPFIENLQILGELSKKMENRKTERGYINFASKDLKILTDVEKNVQGFEKREQRTAEKIIENCMLAANNTFAEEMFWKELPFIFRVHEDPYEGKILDTLEYINGLGFKIHYKQKELTAKNIQLILNQLSEYECYSLLSETILRSMKKAFYSINPEGHFGLALEHYSQITSPIRRFADLQCHIMYKKLKNKTLTEEEKNIIIKETSDICEYISYKEKQCQKAEREVDRYEIAKYMLENQGEAYEGFISYISSSGINVSLEGAIEGKVNYKSIKWDNFSYNKQTKNAIGRDSQIQYKVGDKVTLKIDHVCLENRMPYFEIEDPMINMPMQGKKARVKTKRR